jgi:hypothetical protein
LIPGAHLATRFSCSSSTWASSVNSSDNYAPYRNDSTIEHLKLTTNQLESAVPKGRASGAGV